MKRIVVISVLAFVAKFTFAQNKPPIDSATNKITFQGVVNVTGTKDSLYDKGLTWCAVNFRSANDVIQIRDKEAGKIVGKYVIQPGEARFGFVAADITLFFKDGRYKYIITDMYYLGNSQYKPWAFEDDPNPWSSHMLKVSQKKLKEDTYKKMDALIDNLKGYMAAQNKQDNF